jgi:alpha-galactosidase
VLKILTNRGVIAVDQDAMGKQVERVYSDGEMEVWKRPLKGGALAVAVFNLGSSRFNYPFHLDLARLGMHGSQQVTDLWSGKSMSVSSSTPLDVKSHDVWMVRIDHPH